MVLTDSAISDNSFTIRGKQMASWTGNVAQSHECVRCIRKGGHRYELSGNLIGRRRLVCQQSSEVC